MKYQQQFDNNNTVLSVKEGLHFKSISHFIKKGHERKTLRSAPVKRHCPTFLGTLCESPHLNFQLSKGTHLISHAVMPRKGMNGITLLIHENSLDKTASLDILQKYFILEEGLYDYLSEEPNTESV